MENNDFNERFETLSEEEQERYLDEIKADDYLEDDDREPYFYLV